MIVGALKQHDGTGHAVAVHRTLDDSIWANSGHQLTAPGNIQTLR